MKHAAIALFATLLTLAGVSRADTLSDFQRAASQKGCASIPYDYLNSRCKDAQRKVTEYCKTDKIGCKGLDIDPLKKAIDGMKRKIDSLKRERDQFKRDGNRDEADRVDDEIDDIEKRIDDHKRQIDQNKREIDKRVDRGQRCVDARKRVEGAFKDAKSRAKGESNDEVRPLARQLLKQWEAGERGHADAIRSYNRAIDKCKDKR